MKIGLDFDNTIVRYDDVFYRVALEQGLIPANTPISKVSVRDYLRSVGKEAYWTEMQGYVYGSRMDDVQPFSNVIETLLAARDAGWELFIVSHKTRYPFMGPKYDLHEAARNWILTHLVIDGEPLIGSESINFREQKDSKVERVNELGCDVFLDDLPEILNATNFSDSIRGVLFDPDDHHTDFTSAKRVRSWFEFKEFLEI